MSNVTVIRLFQKRIQAAILPLPPHHQKFFALSSGFCSGLGLGALLFPNLEFHVQRTDGVDEHHEDDGVLGAVEVANAPCATDNWQMDQVRVKARAADFTDNSNAEEAGHEALAREERKHKQSVNENRQAVVDKVIDARIPLWAHEEEASVKGGE